MAATTAATAPTSSMSEGGADAPALSPLFSEETFEHILEIVTGNQLAELGNSKMNYPQRAEGDSMQNAGSCQRQGQHRQKRQSRRRNRKSHKEWRPPW